MELGSWRSRPEPGEKDGKPGNTWRKAHLSSQSPLVRVGLCSRGTEKLLPLCSFFHLLKSMATVQLRHTRCRQSIQP